MARDHALLYSREFPPFPPRGPGARALRLEQIFGRERRLVPNLRASPQWNVGAFQSLPGDGGLPWTVWWIVAIAPCLALTRGDWIRATNGIDGLPSWSQRRQGMREYRPFFLLFGLLLGSLVLTLALGFVLDRHLVD